MESPGTTGRRTELGIVTDVDLISSRRWKSPGVGEITLAAQQQNDEMRGWLEKVAGLVPILTAEEWGYVAWCGHTRRKWNH